MLSFHSDWMGLQGFTFKLYLHYVVSNRSAVNQRKKKKLKKKKDFANEIERLSSPRNIHLRSNITPIKLSFECLKYVVNFTYKECVHNLPTSMNKTIYIVNM